MAWPGTSLRAAEKLAIEGDNEFQDSQTVMDCYQACYAVGEPSSSPQLPRLSAYPLGPDGVAKLDFSRGIQDAPENFADSTDPHASSRQGRATVLACPEASLPSPASVAELDIQIFAKNVRDALLRKEQSHRSTMHSQRQSSTPSTQAILDAALARGLNAGLMDMDPDMVDTQSPGEEEQEHHPRTLQVGDTGAVNFGPDLILESQPSRQPSSMPEDVQLTRGRGTWHADPESQQQTASRNPRETPHRAGVAIDPVTPVLPRNPFLGQAPASILAGSQLFQPSQLPSSSATRQLSPTSSRPSPDDAHSALSPNLPIDTSPIKRTAIVGPSSPAINLLSSQLNLVPSRNGRTADELGPPTSEVVPASPPSPPRNARTTRGRDPAATYEPMHASQERRYNMEISLTVEEDDHENDAEFQRAQRRRRARLKRDEAAKGLAEFGSYLADRQEARRPTKRRKMAKGGGEDIELVPQSSEETTRTRRKTIPETSSASGPEVVKNSQRSRTSDKAQQPPPNIPAHTARSTATEGLVPATSPINSPQPPAQTEPVGLSTAEHPDATDDALTPATRGKHPHRPLKAYRRGSRRSARHTVRSEPENLDADELTKTGPKPTTPPSSKHMPSSPPILREEITLSTVVSPAKDIIDLAATVVRSPSLTSSLSDLSTPSASALTPPVADKAPTGNESITSDSPLGKESRGRPVLPKLAMKHLAIEKRPSSRHKRPPAGHDMTDELAWSPGVFEQSVIAPKLRQPARSISRQPGNLFGGMIFAVSFQNKKTGESDAKYIERNALSEDVQSAVVKGGGKVVTRGFHELFESGTLRLATEAGLGVDDDASPKLSASFIDTGFTALIADGHTRKIKYMEALALGIPCIAHWWVSKCVSTGHIVDWKPYLLCTGESSMLGTVVSRSLVSFSASDANLVDILGKREKLLDGHRVLVFAKVAQDDKMRPYVFLVRALGASVVVARTADQARHAIAQQNSLNTPFDWIYVDEKIQLDSLLQPTGTQAVSAGKGKKRKRAAMPAPPPPTMSFGAGMPRTLTNEFLIQSLILGHVIDEDDWAKVV